MAEHIDNIKRARRGRPPLYPWDEWMDGTAWRIDQGTDFNLPVETMARAIHSTACRHHRAVIVRRNYDAGTIEFQFQPLEDAA